MKRNMRSFTKWPLILLALLLALATGREARAVIDGISSTSFSLTAKDGYISTPDGGSVYMWGYAEGDGLMQYPGPTLIVTEGQTITIELSNTLQVPVSMVFPGQQAIADGGSQGLITREAAAGGTVSYTFTATSPGTYVYHSGTRPELQIEMGLVGALIVRPAAGAGRAYSHPESAYDHEYLFLLTEIDPVIHEHVEFGRMDQIDNTTYFPVWWCINGRMAPDTMAAAGVPWLPHQPYNCLPRMHPGEKMLMRVIGAGRDLHPFHHHGNHARIIARNGRLLESAPGAGPDLDQEVFTIQSVPGQTVDAIFEWTGKDLGWDIYGTGAEREHDCFDSGCTDTDGNGFDDLTLTACYDDVTREYCPDHGKPFPVVLPEKQNLTFGGSYSGSPFLGALGSLPPGEGGMNMYGGYFYMWHSHTEKEMVNFDIFPGGMMTMMIVEPPGAPIP